MGVGRGFILLCSILGFYRGQKSFSYAIYSLDKYGKCLHIRCYDFFAAVRLGYITPNPAKHHFTANEAACLAVLVVAVIATPYSIYSVGTVKPLWLV